MHHILVSLVLLSVSLWQSPAIGQWTSIQKQLPAGFTLLDSASGYLNDDRLKDYLLVLQTVEGERLNADTVRPLLIFLQKPGGGYQLAARNDKAVLCRGCGGIMGDPYQRLVVKNGVFTVEHYGGSAWRWTRYITFRHAGKGRFVLKRDSGESWWIHDEKKTRKTHDRNRAYYNRMDFTAFDYETGLQ